MVAMNGDAGARDCRCGFSASRAEDVVAPSAYSSWRDLIKLRLSDTLTEP